MASDDENCFCSKKRKKGGEEKNFTGGGVTGRFVGRGTGQPRKQQSMACGRGERGAVSRRGKDGHFFPGGGPALGEAQGKKRIR